MFCEPSFHRRGNAQSLMDATEVVIGMVDRNHVAVILKLLGKHTRQAPSGAAWLFPGPLPMLQ
jgi:hypothetical protein